jgi:protoporphyrinogen oxidase
MSHSTALIDNGPAARAASEASRPPPRTAVIGAGPMGLACAYELSRRGYAVSVFEADDRIGGMSAAFDFDGLKIERYYHFICKPDRPLFAMLDEFGLADRLRWKTTEMGFFYEGRLYDWGRPDCLLRFPDLGLADKLRYALHVMHTKGIDDWSGLDKVEATRWLRRWVGERTYRVLWHKLFELKFFEHHDQLSAAWIGTRIKRVALSRKSLFQEELGYLDGGSEVLLDAYRRRIEAAGGGFHLRAPVQRVATKAGRAVGVVVGGELHPAEIVVSTVPLSYVPRIAPDLSQRERESIDAILNIGVVCVLLKMERPLTNYFWMNLHDPRLEVPGVIEYTNLNPLPQHVLYVPYYMPKSHPKWQWERERFVDEVKRYMRIIRPDWDEATLLASHVSRYEFAQPVCGPGFFDRLPKMKTSVAGFLMADTSYYYPEDRSIAESIRVGRELAERALEPAA